MCRVVFSIDQGLLCRLDRVLYQGGGTGDM